MASLDACHQRTWSFRSVSRWAPDPPVRKSLTTLPMSKSVQSDGFSGFVPVLTQFCALVVLWQPPWAFDLGHRQRQPVRWNCCRYHQLQPQLPELGVLPFLGT